MCSTGIGAANLPPNRRPVVNPAKCSKGSDMARAPFGVVCSGIVTIGVHRPRPCRSFLQAPAKKTSRLYSSARGRGTDWALPSSPDRKQHSPKFKQPFPHDGGLVTYPYKSSDSTPP
jgi:hypothetical protein